MFELVRKRIAKWLGLSRMREDIAKLEEEMKIIASMTDSLALDLEAMRSSLEDDIRALEISHLSLQARVKMLEDRAPTPRRRLVPVR